MRYVRIAVLLTVAAVAFAGCKKGGGYLTLAPVPALAQ
jgi:hypothetical protein